MPTGHSNHEFMKFDHFGSKNVDFLIAKLSPSSSFNWTELVYILTKTAYSLCKVEYSLCKVHIASAIIAYSLCKMHIASAEDVHIASAKCI